MDNQNLQGQQQNDHNCSLCTNPPDTNMATCIKCSQSFHKGCINIADNIPYECLQCSANRPTSPAPSSTSHRSNISHQSQSRRIELQLQKLDEERALNLEKSRLEQEFINKKYQLLEEVNELSDAASESQSVRNWPKDLPYQPITAKSQTVSSRQLATKITQNSTIQQKTYLQDGTLYAALPANPNTNSKQMSQNLNVIGSTAVANAANNLPTTSAAPIFASATTTNSGYRGQMQPQGQQTVSHQPSVTFTNLPPNNIPIPQPHFNQNIAPSFILPNQQAFNNNAPMASTMYAHAPNITTQDLNFTQNLQQSHINARKSVPKELPTFSGNPEEWPLFISTYEWSTATCCFNFAENLIRLQTSLKNDALHSVQHMLIHPSNVPNVIEILRMLYGQPEKIINAIKNRINLSAKVDENNLHTLTSFAINVRSLIATITAGNLPDELNNSSLLQELVQKLPPSYQMQWATLKMQLHNQNKKANLLAFDNWLFNIGLTASSITVEHTTNNQSNNNKTTNRAFVNSHSDERKCVVCNNNCKAVSACPTYQSYDRGEKWTVVREHKLCKYCLCLHSGECRRKKKCGKEGCEYYHHPSLHRYLSSTYDENNQTSTANKTNVNYTHVLEEDEEEVINNAHSAKNRNILFKIIPIKIHGNNKIIKTYAFIDEGSSISLMDESIATELKLNGVANPLCLRWTGGMKRSENNSKKLTIEISGANKRRLNINVCTVESLNLPTQSLDYEMLSQRYRHLRKLPVTSYSDAAPKLLIGLNNFEIGISRKIREGLQHAPVAVCTKLGWLIYGTVVENKNPSKNFNFHICDCSASDDKTDELVDSCSTQEIVEICTEDPLVAENEQLLVSGNHHENDAVPAAAAPSTDDNNSLMLIPNEPKMVRYINESFIVSCRSRTTDAKLHWKSPKGEIIKDDHRARVHIERTANAEELKLVFMHLTLDDKGNWSCFDADTELKATKSLDLIVYQKITFKESTTVLTVKEGEDTTIWCEVTGEPQPNITWYFNGEFIPNIENATKFRYLGDGLSVIAVTQNETGEYTCRAYQVSSIASDMQERTILMKIEHKPMWNETAGPTEHYAYLNGTAQFRCNALAEPPGNFTWYRNKKQIHNDKHFNIEHDNYISILHVKAHDNTVFSAYKCKVQNHLGSIERAFKLERGEKPPKPHPLALRGLNSNTFDIELSFTKPTNTKSNMRVRGFRFEYITELQFKKDAGIWTNAQYKEFAHASGATYLLNNLEANTTYLVRAASRNIAGLSDWSKVEKLTTQFNQTSGSSSSICSSFTHILCFILVALILSHDLTLALPGRSMTNIIIGRHGVGQKLVAAGRL